MVERYKNIFHFYRGPSSRDEKSGVDIQLEDNFTKALINLMDPGNIKERVSEENKEWCKTLLGVIFQDSDERKAMPDLGAVCEVDLQEQPFEEKGSKNRRLDAVVVFDKGRVGIESKVDSLICISQLRDEFEQLKLCNTNGETYLFLIAKKNAIDNSKANLDDLKKEKGIDGRIRTISWERVYENLKEYEKEYLRGKGGSREKFW